jgi:hypothetical protein
MPEQSEDLIVAAKPKAPLWKRVRAWTIILGLYAATLAMVVFAVTLVQHSFRSGTAIEDRLCLLLGAGMLLVLPVRVAWVYICSKWITGRWLVTKQKRDQTFSQCSTRRLVASQTPPWSWLRFAANWANYSAMESSLPLWQCVLGWTLLVAFAALLLFVIALGVIMMGAGIATIHTGGLVMVGFGALVLLIPGQVAWSYIGRYRTTGSIRTTQDELRQMSAQITEWRAREWRKPLRTKILSMVVITAIFSVWWIRVALRHSRHAHESWFNPALWTLFAIYAMWIQFRKPKALQSQTSVSATRSPSCGWRCIGSFLGHGTAQGRRSGTVAWSCIGAGRQRQECGCVLS